jgi:hypothetical protein
LAETDDDARPTKVRDNEVGAAAEREHRHISRTFRSQNLAHAAEIVDAGCFH